MSKNPTWLLDFKHNVYSQGGEDGVLSAILDRLPDTDRWCVEFGAWDGIHLSNVRNLIQERDYSAVMIEGSHTRSEELRSNYADNPRVFPVNAFVGFTAADGLDRILADTPITRDFDLLSIDIDGNDYHVWKAVGEYRPKVVCIEFNQTIPTGVEFVQPADPAVNQGSSVSAMVALGREKGYQLVCVLDLNAIFVRDDYFPLFEIQDNSPWVLRTNASEVTYLFSGYDGTVFLRGGMGLPWHGMRLRESKFQLLPRFLRRFPSNYSVWQRLLFRVYKFLENPMAKFRKLAAKRRA
ncbi:MAG: FkbM family methyltransferase [Gammaproteobacteria bacterium]|nr:FkbM family methyltransferase [Gammaproteobacteria bacterium]